MFKRIPAGFGLILMAVLVCAPVGAQQPSPDLRRCVNEGKAFSLNEQISACTAILQSARETPSNLAIAYQSRLKAYRDKRERDRGTVDPAMKLNLNSTAATAQAPRQLTLIGRKDDP
jgi:hypothetical protein